MNNKILSLSFWCIFLLAVNRSAVAIDMFEFDTPRGVYTEGLPVDLVKLSYHMGFRIDLNSVTRLDMTPETLERFLSREPERYEMRDPHDLPDLLTVDKKFWGELFSYLHDLYYDAASSKGARAEALFKGANQLRDALKDYMNLKLLNSLDSPNSPNSKDTSVGTNYQAIITPQEILRTFRNGTQQERYYLGKTISEALNKLKSNSNINAYEALKEALRENPEVTERLFGEAPDLEKLMVRNLDKFLVPVNESSRPRINNAAEVVRNFLELVTKAIKLSSTTQDEIDKIGKGTNSNLNMSASLAEERIKEVVDLTTNDYELFEKYANRLSQGGRFLQPAIVRAGYTIPGSSQYVTALANQPRISISEARIILKTASEMTKHQGAAVRALERMQARVREPYTKYWAMIDREQSNRESSSGLPLKQPSLWTRTLRKYHLKQEIKNNLAKIDDLRP